jgi:nucleoside-diphosphate-sugar epimerase
MILENKVALGQVLFAGGSGFVGRTAVRWFRERHPSVRVLVGGRNDPVVQQISVKRRRQSIATCENKAHLTVTIATRRAKI